MPRRAASAKRRCGSTWSRSTGRRAARASGTTPERSTPTAVRRTAYQTAQVMPERSKDWLRQADADLRHAHNAKQAGDYDWSAFASHQAAEMAIKALFQA